MIKEISYPRAALIGNPSDGYYGKTIAFVFRNYSANVTIYESPELEILPSVLDYNVYSSIDELSRSIGKFGYYGGIRLLKGCIKKFYEYTRLHDIRLEDKNFTIRYQSDIPNRLGMAGSSAIITATIRAVMKFYDVHIPQPVLANLVLAVEKDELGIPAGLQDRVAQVYQYPVYMDFNRAHMEKFGYGDYSKIEIPSDLPLYIAYRTDLAEGSEILHSRLRDDFEAGKPSVLAAVKEWAELTEHVRDALAIHDFSRIPEWLNRNFDLRCEVCGTAISAKNRRMVEIARSFGASAKFTGSGGCIVGTYLDDSLVEMIRAFRYEHIELIKPEIVTEGYPE